jgi:hypothetical protein
MNRRRRSLAASIAAFALAFAQLAVSAHACALHEAPGPSEVKAHSEACHEMAAPEDEAPANGNVCQEHCRYGSASVDTSPPDAALADPVGPVLRVELSDAAVAPADVRPSWRLAPAAAPPPPAILFGVLRI